MLPCYAFESLLEKCDSTSQTKRFVCRCFFSIVFFSSKKKCHMEFTRFSAQPIQWNVFQKTCFLFLSIISIKLLFYVLRFAIFSASHSDSTNEMHTDFIFALFRSVFVRISLFFSIFRFVERCFWVHNQLKIQSLKI